MEQKTMRQKLKIWGVFLMILLLLPYVVTVLTQGIDSKASGKSNGPYIRVVETLENEEEQITELPWEEYFIGILAREAPEPAEEEFLKAQAVLIRTKLYQALEQKKANDEEVVLEEPYLKQEDMERRMLNFDYETYYKKLVQAMTETENQVLLYQDKYAFVPFHQSSNGLTRSYQEVTGDTSYPYLVVRECAIDKEAEDEMQSMTFEYLDVQKKCHPFLVAVNEKESKKTYKFSDFEIISHDSAGYVAEMRIGETICTGDQFRDALSLPSSSFSIKDADGRLKVTTIGKGHGLGMSQWMANEMAKNNKTYAEILQYFYEGTTLVDGGIPDEKLHFVKKSE